MTRRLPLLLLPLLLVLAAGCATPRPQCPPLPWDVSTSVADVEALPQDPMFYAARLGQWDAPSARDLEKERQRFRERYLAPWQGEKSAYSREQAMWGVSSYGSKKGYAENLRPRDAAWFQELTRRAQPASFPSLARKAIAVRNTSLRSMPSNKPFFYDPREAGEGFPFDYFQNSALWAGTPVFVSHQSVDGAWLYAEAPFAAGWVPAQDLGFVSPDAIEHFTHSPWTAVIRDATPVHDTQGRYLFTAHVGCLLPMRNANPAAVLAPVRDAHGEALLVEATLPPAGTTAFPLPLNPKRMAALAQGLVDQPYGWGGLYENRDCSALTRDLMTPFGIWLPRNSKAQVKEGRNVSLKDLAPEQKEKRLLREGVPFRTLVGKPGHVMLYLGEYQGRAMLLHNIWGLATQDACGREGRQVIGRAVITTLTPGRELEGVKRSGYSLQKSIEAMTILVSPAD